MTLSAVEQTLLAEAHQQRQRAHAPWSCFSVGAAVATTDRQVFGGCNVENVSFGLSMCAERVAIFKAVSSGADQFSRLLILASPLAPPCGACRQVMSAFLPETAEVISIDADRPDQIRRWTMGELLPDQFRLKRD